MQMETRGGGWIMNLESYLSVLSLLLFQLQAFQFKGICRQNGRDVMANSNTSSISSPELLLLQNSSIYRPSFIIHQIHPPPDRHRFISVINSTFFFISLPLQLTVFFYSHDRELQQQAVLFRLGGIKQVAVAVLAAGILTLTAGGDASAAKSGGRIGGQSFRSSQPPPSRSTSPRINNNSSSRSRTNIYVNPPPVAPPLVGGYGYGYYGGWGWSPFSFFAPPAPVAVGVGFGGFDTLALFLFLGAAAAVFRRFIRSFGDRDNDSDD
ncbi:hypothetical protein LINPERPRIM_LOCUS43681 [Linum perenne]